MRPSSLLLALLAMWALACGGTPPSGSSRSSSEGSASSASCTTLCDPMTGGNRYKDAAYSKTYRPCLNEAARQGTTVQALRCEEKATAACMSMCQSDR